MPEAGSIEIAIAWVAQGKVCSCELQVPQGCTLGQAVTRACELGLLPAEALEQTSAAVFGRARKPDHRLYDGDRIELPGPLQVDPKVARERRVAHRRAAEPRSRWRPQG
ncbi:MAG TPA: RnfH family protein [Burkholderiaceae bacterium]|nr:RnfH family protein [Burkholderiaceae bacterium]